MKEFEVIVGATDWAMNGVNILSANLVRELNAAGVRAHVLLTEEGSGLVRIGEPLMPFPEDIPSRRLPLGSEKESWGGHQGALIRYLEERAPCVYLLNHDWHHSVVCSHLSRGVKVVGTAHSDDPQNYEHIDRVGRYLDAIVTSSDSIANQILSKHPDLAPRVTTILTGVPVPAIAPAREPRDGRPLKLVCHGGLVLREKRVLDLPKIVEAAIARGVPVELTLIGAGAQRDELAQAARHWIERGAMKLVGMMPHAQVLEALGQFDIYLLTSDFEEMPGALEEAMGCGCVPIVTDIRSGVRDWVRDGENGFVVPIGGIDEFADRIERLYRDAALWNRLSANAHTTILEGGGTAAGMAAKYIDLFEGLFKQPSFQRPGPAHIRMPPNSGEGRRVFTLDKAEHYEGTGVFHCRDDNMSFLDEDDSLRGRRIPPATSKLPRPYPNVVIAQTSGRLSGVDVFSSNLAKGLTAMGVSAHVLFTDPYESTPDPMPLPEGTPTRSIPFVRLHGSWPRRWRAFQQELERYKYCVYLPNYDWRFSCISPRLPPSVAIVGIAHSDDPTHYEHVLRLGKYWNAIVAVSSTIAEKIAEADPSLAPRLSVIPYGIAIPPALPERAPGKRLRLIYAGRFVEYQKRVHDLPKIFEALIESGVDAEFTLVGGGLEEKALKEACARWDGRVRFTGTLANELVLREFASHDVFLLASEFEGLPVSMLEAMAAGCVPVVSDVHSGVRGLIRDGENGFRVPVGDITGFAARLRQLNSDRTRLAAMSAEAHRSLVSGRFGLHEMAVRYQNLFDEVLVAAELGEFKRPQGDILPPPGMEAELLRTEGRLRRWTENSRSFLLESYARLRGLD